MSRHASSSNTEPMLLTEPKTLQIRAPPPATRRKIAAHNKEMPSTSVLDSALKGGAKPALAKSVRISEPPLPRTHVAFDASLPPRKSAGRKIRAELRNFWVSVDISFDLATVWESFLAAIAFAEIITFFPIFLNEFFPEVEEVQSSRGVGEKNVADAGENDTVWEHKVCSWGSPYDQSTVRPLSWQLFIGPAFIAACSIDALVRARKARARAVDDAVEAAISKSMALSPEDIDASEDDQDDDLILLTSMNKWWPIAWTLTFWLSLLPMNFLGVRPCADLGKDAALFTMWYGLLLRRLHVLHVSAQLIVHAKYINLRRRLARFAVRHPLKMWRRTRAVLRTVRWIKFGAPFFRAVNRLSVQARDLMKKWMQNMKRRRAQRKRNIERSQMREEIRKLDAASCIQATMRARKAKKSAQVLKELNQRREVTAAMKLQRRMRKSLRRMKVEDEKVKNQLHCLKMQLSTKSIRTLQGRFSQLKEDLSFKVKKMSYWLVRPTSRFAFFWNTLSVWCIILEISNLTISARTGKTVGEHLNLHLFETENCGGLEAPRTEDRFLGRFIRPVLDKLPFFDMKSEPVCEEVAAPWKEASSTIILYGVETFVEVVCFLDIFVWFFTGDFDQNGAVVPKPFVARWIVPGLLIQLVDCPTTPRLFALSKLLLRLVHAAGPARVLRWFLAVFPVAMTLVVRPTIRYFCQDCQDQDNKALPPEFPRQKSMMLRSFVY